MGQIEYKTVHELCAEDIKNLYASVNWISANYADRLVKAFRKADTVITAWDGTHLVGLLEAIDDGEVTAYIHYLLVHSEYQGQGIGSMLLSMTKDIYKDYLYLVAVVEEEKNITFYNKAGFETVSSATPVHILKK